METLVFIALLLSGVIGFFIGRREAEQAFKKGTRRWNDGVLYLWLPPDRPDKEGIWFKR